MATNGRRDFGAALLGGLAELGPIDPFSGDLSLELGLSLWLRRSETSLSEARERLFDVRRAIVEVAGLNPSTEPVPLMGRSPRADVITLAAYLGDLLRRASMVAGCSTRSLVGRVLAVLPEPVAADPALGA
jgi:hypothetical protein